MAGGLIQLSVYGAEDVYLTSRPQITFFKTVYRRHTNFSTQVFDVNINDNPNFGFRNRVQIRRLGDLITKMYLIVEIPQIIPNDGTKFAWVRRLGHALLKSVSIEIGGVLIDTQYGEWLDIWYELARSGKHESGYAKMIGDIPELTNYDSSTKPSYVLYIPLKFWFNRYNGLALPIISIQYHEIYLLFEFNNRETLIVTNNNFNQITDIRIVHASVLTEYVYLDVVERDKFAMGAHEYLIEQVQYLGNETFTIPIKRVQLDFKHPVKELIWFIKNGNYTTGQQFLAYSNTNTWTNAISAASLQILKDSYVVLQGPIYLKDSSGNFVLTNRGKRIIISPGETNPYPGTWEEIPPITTKTTLNNQFVIINQSQSMSFWINTSSLIVNNYVITNNLSGTITLSSTNQVTINTFNSTISVRDVSFPVSQMIDTRISNTNDVFVNQFNNYGILIDGSSNPFEFALLDYNDEHRFDKRNGKFFNYLQPEMHHSNTPADGVNVYSFSIKPEQHQPSGTSNMSLIDRIIMTFWLNDSTQSGNLPSIDLNDSATRLYLYGFSYNVFRCAYGLATTVYQS